MKKIINIFLILIFCFTIKAYLIEYKINNIQYKLYYDLEENTVEMWRPVYRDILVSDTIKTHWVNNYEKSFSKNPASWRYMFVMGVGNCV